MNIKDIGKRIQKVRKELGMTQQELADKSGVLLTTVTKIENGIIKNPTIEKLAKLAEALDISIDKLVE
jgi:transcriptional regulator with XRE-family HTH domain